jgi:hypothetical protein
LISISFLISPSFNNSIEHESLQEKVIQSNDFSSQYKDERISNKNPTSKNTSTILVDNISLKSLRRFSEKLMKIVNSLNMAGDTYTSKNKFDKAALCYSTCLQFMDGYGGHEIGSCLKKFKK